MSRIKISLNGNLLELEGSDDFIKTNLELMKKIEQAAPVPQTLNQQPSSNPVKTPINNSISENLSDLYPYVYHKTDEGFNIISSELPGNSNAEKTRTLALIYLYGKKFMMSEDSADSNELRSLATKFGCLDSKNFAKHLAATKPHLAFNGKKGGNKTYTITRPGENEAKKIVSEINEKESAEN